MTTDKVSALASWLTSLANTVADRTGRTGVLKIYSDRRFVPRVANCVALDRLIEHTKMDRDDVVAAVGSLIPTAGTGDRVHVVVTTAEREDMNAREKKLKDSINKSNQTDNRLVYLRAAAVNFSDNLPDFFYADTSDAVN